MSLRTFQQAQNEDTDTDTSSIYSFPKNIKKLVFVDDIDEVSSPLPGTNKPLLANANF